MVRITDSESFYVLYALNSDGKEAFYQYDSADNTYQRYTIDNTNDEQGQASSGLRRLFDILRDNIDRFLVGIWLVFLLLLITIIILAIKLHHRNLELDDLYDEYGIDLDEEEEQKPAKVKKKAATVKKAKGGPTVRRPAQIDLDDEEDSDNFKDYEEEDDEIIDDLDELLSSQPKKKHGHMDPDDIFKVDLD